MGVQIFGVAPAKKTKLHFEGRNGHTCHRARTVKTSQHIDQDLSYTPEPRICKSVQVVDKIFGRVRSVLRSPIVSLC